MGKIFYKGVDYSSPTSSGVSGVKGNKETVYRVGNVNITPENVGALAENGDSKDNTVTFTSADSSTADAWEDVTVLASKEKHSSLFGKISTMFKNVRYIYTHFIKSENILDTLEEIVANKQSGKVAGALAVKELNGKLVKRKTVIKTISNQTYAVITDSELNIGAAFILDVNIERNPNYGYHFVNGHGFDSSGNLFVYFDGTINATVTIMIHYATL